MIDVKILAKPKSSSSSSGSSSKTSYVNTTVSEAEHASKADKAIRAESADRADYASRAGTATSATYAAMAGELDADAAVLEKYLRKDIDDTANGKVTFADVATFLKGLFLDSDGKYSITSEGKAILDLLQSADYSYDGQQGFSFYKRSDGKYGLNITDLLVWGKAIFNSLEIRKLYSVGGNIVLSPSASKIIQVDEVRNASGDLTGWKCYLLADDGTMATTNQWQVDDQVRCQTFDIEEGTYQGVSNKNYWRLVTSVSTQNEEITAADGTVLYDGKKFSWIVIGKTDCMVGSDTPQAGDTIVCMGNRTVEDRQNLIILETQGDSAPRIVCYKFVRAYSLDKKDIFSLSYDGFKVESGYFNFTAADGSKLVIKNNRGFWSSSATYYYYDEVTHDGTLWLCIAPEGTAVTEEPSEDSTYWRAETAIVKPKLVLYHDLGAGISLGETHTITCRGMMGDQDITSTLTNWAVTRSTGDSVEDAAWLTRSKVKAFDGTFALTWVLDVSESDMGNGETAVFTFSAKRPSGETLTESIGIIT